MGKLSKALLLVGGTVSGVALATALTLYLTPRPGAYLIKKIFDRPYEIKLPEEYEKAAKQVKVIRNGTYSIDTDKSSYDLYLPVNLAEGERVPVLVWLHGGGFVGGDKEQMLEFATYVTAQTGLAVLCLNYDLAPKAKYPSQLAQLNEAVQHIQSNSDLVEFIDTEQWFFGGDSAGAQIAGQYVLIQTNENYRHHLGYSASLTPSKLKGFIAYCGPLAMNLLANRQSNHPAIKFFYNTVSRSVIGNRQWSQSPELSEASLANHVNAQFPSSFVTDGNKFTFDDHGKYFVKRLVELGVAVEHLFIETEELVHEYQFEYQTAAAQRCLAETIAFIKANHD